MGVLSNAALAYVQALQGFALNHNRQRPYIVPPCSVYLQFRSVFALKGVTCLLTIQIRSILEGPRT